MQVVAQVLLLLLVTDASSQALQPCRALVSPHFASTIRGAVETDRVGGGSALCCMPKAEAEAGPDEGDEFIVLDEELRGALVARVWEGQSKTGEFACLPLNVDQLGEARKAVSPR